MIISFLRKSKGNIKEYIQHQTPSARNICSNFQNELTERWKRKTKEMKRTENEVMGMALMMKNQITQIK